MKVWYGREAGAGLQRHGGAERGLGLLNLGGRRPLGLHGGEQDRAFLLGHGERLVGGGRNARQIRLGRELARALAHHVHVFGAAGVELAGRQRELGLGGDEARLGLGQVGLGEVAQGRAGLGLLIDGVDVGDLVAQDGDDLAIAAHVLVGGDHVQDELGLGLAQVLAPGADVGAGGLDLGVDGAVGEQRLGQRQLGLAGGRR